MRALVLSAGGMFGAWQAGAWRGIAPYFEPELIVGASAGSLNGWAIAGGCTPDDLIAQWREAGGSPARIIERLTAAYTPRIPFSAVVTDIFARRTIAIAASRCDARILAASCAVPPLLWPRRIDGRWCADGGFITATPVIHAAELGATEIVVLNALAGWQSPLRRQRPTATCGGAVLELKPREPFGGTVRMLRWNAARVRKWLAQGEADGSRFVEENKAFFRAGDAAPPVEHTAPTVLS